MHERRQQLPRPDNIYEALMAEPHTPNEHTMADLLQLRETLLDVMDEILTPAEIELITAAHLSDETFTSAAQRLGMPYATAWYAADNARKKLKDALQDNPTVQTHLEAQQ